MVPLLTVLLLGPSARALADEGGSGVDVAPVTGGLSVGVGTEFPGSQASEPARPGEIAPVLVVDPGVDLIEAFCDGINWTDGCDVEPVDESEVDVTPGMIAAAFQRLPLPPAQLVVQPPNGRTLVNFETNFYTEQGEFTRTVRLLGRQVELRIWPERFGWEFGDGHERWTTSPGDKYPNLEVTHRYLSKGRVAPSVATTYAAQFRVGDGPWRDVTGTVTIPGAAQSLRVVTARPVLVGGS